MKQLKHFIYGIVFCILVTPVLESLAEVAATALELLKGKLTLPILRMNKEINDIQASEEEISTNVIGFEIPNKDDYYDDDDDDFHDKLRQKKKR